MAQVESVVDTILAEAGGKTPAERFEDMKAIASVAYNRAKQTGVSLKDVVRAKGQFSAYGKASPPGVEKYRSLAERALREVQESGPVHNATFYATPSAVGRLPGGLEAETSTAGHRYFTDPQNRSIRTAKGYVEPSGSAMLVSYAPTSRVDAGASAFDSLFGGHSAMPQQSLSGRRGLLSDEAAPAGLLSDLRTGYGSPFGALGDRITSGFGSRTPPRTSLGLGSSNHRGIDMSLQGGASGYPVEAAAGGVVTYAGPRKGYGNMVEVAHPDGMTTRYGHLQSIGNVAIGDEIARGTPVGLVGNTGKSKGPHLHFETIDAKGRQIDPRSVIGFDAASRVPTPEARPETWKSAVPLAVERRALPSLTPDTGIANRMMGDAKVAQGMSGLRAALSGEGNARRATPAEMTTMQAEANRARQALEARNGTLSLTDAQRRDAMARRDTALGILSSAPQTVLASTPKTTLSTTPTTTTAKTGRLAADVSLASMPSNVAATQRLTGLSPTLTSTMPVGALSSPLKDISAPLSQTEFTGLLSNPATTMANKFGLSPTMVKTAPVQGLLSTPEVDPAIVAGPATAEIVTTPRTVARRAAGPVGLLSPDEYNAVRAQQISLQAQGQNKKAQLGAALKSGLGAFGGGVLGGMLAGPIGAVVGGYLGNSMATPGGILSSFPEAPKGGILGDGKETSYGKSVRESSGQYRSAVSKGSKGLY